MLSLHPLARLKGEKAVWWVRGEVREVIGPELGEWRPGFVPQV